MPQQYSTTADAMYAEYKQSPVPSPYQESYPIVYPHANFQHYRSSIPLSSGYEFGYDYGQQYYSASQSTNSYGMLPPYNGTTNNAFGAYNTGNFHATPMHPMYENLTIPPSTDNLLNIKTELGSEQSETIDSNFVDKAKNSPIESSDRSECSYSSKLEIGSKVGEIINNAIEPNYGDRGASFGKEENTSSEF